MATIQTDFSPVHSAYEKIESPNLLIEFSSFLAPI